MTEIVRRITNILATILFLVPIVFVIVPIVFFGDEINIEKVSVISLMMICAFGFLYFCDKVQKDLRSSDVFILPEDPNPLGD